MTTYSELVKETTKHLILTGCTYSAEVNPVLLRNKPVDEVVDKVISYLLAKGVLICEQPKSMV